MPRNRKPQDREQKRDEIIVTARRLFVEDGYEVTSMSTVAREVGVAVNTIYWYFRDKDDLLIAVLDAVVGDALIRYDSVATTPIAARLRWLLLQLNETRHLVTAVHARAADSPAVDTWHRRFHETSEALLNAALRDEGVPASELAAETQIVVFTIEGLITHELAVTHSDGICDALARRWTSGDPAAAG